MAEKSIKKSTKKEKIVPWFTHSVLQIWFGPFSPLKCENFNSNLIYHIKNKTISVGTYNNFDCQYYGCVQIEGQTKQLFALAGRVNERGKTIGETYLTVVYRRTSPLMEIGTYEAAVPTRQEKPWARITPKQPQITSKYFWSSVIVSAVGDSREHSTDLVLHYFKLLGAEITGKAARY